MSCLMARLEHLVLTTANEAAGVHFYCAVRSMELQTFDAGRKAFVWSGQKISLHLQGKEFEPKAQRPPGSLDLCFISSVPLAQVQQQLAQHGIAIECGPVQRTGARGPIRSVYMRAPDLNLIEISEYL